MSGTDPQTLTDLLRALERSGDLRTLARECGLSVRELRRRLAIWRRELQADHESDDHDVEGSALADRLVVPARSATTATDGAAEDAADDFTDDTGDDTAADASDVPARDDADGASRSGARADDDRWASLPAAAGLERSPLPTRGRMVMEIFTDGASRGNPGPASIGIVFRRKDGEDLAEHSEAIGRATNNAAEYRAVVAALGFCQRWGVKRVHLRMDSELIVRQLLGVYRVKSPELRPLYQQVVFMSRGLAEFQVTHVRREQNAHADALANRALDA